MTSKMSRSAYGFSTGEPDPRWRQAACLTNPEMFFAAGYRVDARLGRARPRDSPAGRARHICLQHCPALDACRAATQQQPTPPIGVVQAGLRWRDTSADCRQGPAAAQPADPGHGRWCRGV